ncbi:MAG: DMT family transporter [Anaerolineae bacterium]|nr:DMT family transporter [Anaerolineae bacterium]
MRHWTTFGFLTLIWGSSFLLIKIGVEELEPLPLVSLRLGGAALIMGMLVALTRRSWPSNPRERAALVVVGLVNTAVPFTLITWGEQNIDSGLATVLNATTPLFTLAIAHVALADERITPQKAAGLIIGFLGVALLASRDAESSSPNSFSGQIAILGAAVCYAISGVTIRRYLHNVEPMTTAGYSTIIGGTAVVSVTLITRQPIPAVNSLSADTLLAVLTLAVVNTAIAYFLFYRLIHAWGATRTSLVTYALPPIGVTLGAIFLDETVDWKIIAGAALIMFGIVAVNLRMHPRHLTGHLKPQPSPPCTD